MKRKIGWWVEALDDLLWGHHETALILAGFCAVGFWLAWYHGWFDFGAVDPNADSLRWVADH